MGTPGGGVAHRGRLLEGDADAATRGVFDGLFGAAVEVVVLQTVWRGGRRGLRWAQEHARPTRPTGGRGRGPRGARCRAASRGCGEMGKGVCVCVVSECWKVLWAKQGMCSERETRSLSDAGGSVQRKGRKCVRFCVSGH